MDHKLLVLEKLANLFNKNNITWAIGGSVLLYFKGITNHFNDLDVLIHEKDIDKVQILLREEVLLAPIDNGSYQSTAFMQYIIDGVDIDIIAGFSIMNDKQRYYFPLLTNEDLETYKLNETIVYLDKLSAWSNYYALMQRMDKHKLIEAYLSM